MIRVTEIRAGEPKESMTFLEFMDYETIDEAMQDYVDSWLTNDGSEDDFKQTMGAMGLIEWKDDHGGLRVFFWDVDTSEPYCEEPWCPEGCCEGLGQQW